MNMIKIHKTAKLPLDICKGSYKDRISLAKELNCKFFDEINKKFTQKTISYDVFEKTLKKSTPAEINVKVNPYNKKGGTTCLYLDDIKNCISEHLIYIEKRPFMDGLGILDTGISLHETMHYFTSIANPKHIARMIKMFETGTLEKTEKFYKEILYTRNKFDKKTTQQTLSEFLKQFTPEEQIDFLQNSRYRLLEEYHAYDEGYKYLDKIQDSHPELICEKIYAREKEDYHFPEKIEIIKEKLKEIFANHSNLNNNK